MLESDDKFGFIVMDGNGCLFGTLAGNTREILHKFSVDLPKKHGRGGQSALRFARLRLEKRHNYVRKVAEVAGQMFLSNDKVIRCPCPSARMFRVVAPGRSVLPQYCARSRVLTCWVTGERGRDRARRFRGLQKRSTSVGRLAFASGRAPGQSVVGF